MEFGYGYITIAVMVGVICFFVGMAIGAGTSSRRSIPIQKHTPSPTPKLWGWAMIQFGAFGGFARVDILECTDTTYTIIVDNCVEIIPKYGTGWLMGGIQNIKVTEAHQYDPPLPPSVTIVVERVKEIGTFTEATIDAP